ncbi:hypothetical protein, partial [Aeromonas caviae]|uniref:hypothetical protein n=1 Tax=Aeromonas caviae TaxID=648 RepID=UPI001FC815CC
VGFCLGEGQEIDWIGHTEYSETRIEQLDHIFNLIGITGGQASRQYMHALTPNLLATAVISRSGRGG